MHTCKVQAHYLCHWWQESYFPWVHWADNRGPWARPAAHFHPVGSSTCKLSISINTGVCLPMCVYEKWTCVQHFPVQWSFPDVFYYRSCNKWSNYYSDWCILGQFLLNNLLINAIIIFFQEELYLLNILHTLYVTKNPVTNATLLCCDSRRVFQLYLPFSSPEALPVCLQHSGCGCLWTWQGFFLSQSSIAKRMLDTHTLKEKKEEEEEEEEEEERDRDSAVLTQIILCCLQVCVCGCGCFFQLCSAGGRPEHQGQCLIIAAWCYPQPNSHHHHHHFYR